jgi:hypothetical protein
MLIATMVTRTRLAVTLYVHCLSFSVQCTLTRTFTMLNNPPVYEHSYYEYLSLFQLGAYFCLDDVIPLVKPSLVPAYSHVSVVGPRTFSNAQNVTAFPKHTA